MKNQDKGFLYLTNNLTNNKINFVKNIVEKKNEINKIMTFDLFHVKNFSNNFIRIYSSESLKFILNIMYLSISPNIEDAIINLNDAFLIIFLKRFSTCSFL